MITRVAESIAKPGMTEELWRVIENEVSPIVKTQPGFVDKITLVLESEPRFVLVVSFWSSMDDVNHYDRELLPKVNEMLRPLVEKGPTIRMFEMRVSARKPRGKAKGA